MISKLSNCTMLMNFLSGENAYMVPTRNLHSVLESILGTLGWREKRDEALKSPLVQEQGYRGAI